MLAAIFDRTLFPPISRLTILHQLQVNATSKIPFPHIPAASKPPKSQAPLSTLPLVIFLLGRKLDKSNEGRPGWKGCMQISKLHPTGELTNMLQNNHRDFATPAHAP